MTITTTGQLRAAGATLPYRVRGSGPLLLLIAGGEGGQEGYENLAEALAGSYTVVTYDRRGAPGTQLDDPAAEVSLETHSEDAHTLLASLAVEPALVFGSSAGALTGLDLAIRYPGQVRTLVAHEPPVEGLMPEFDQGQVEVDEALQKGGVPAAMGLFFARLGMRFDNLEPGVVLPQRNPQDAAIRGQALMRYTFPAVHHYLLDVEALAALPMRLVLAGGSDGQDAPVYHCTQTLASRLDQDLVEFPGQHNGYITHPRAFAARLQEVLG